MEISNKKVIRDTLHKAFNIFRFLFKEDTKMMTKIDKIYEKELEKTLDVIPDAALDDVVKGIYCFNSVLSSINFKTLNNELSKAPFDVFISYDVYKNVYNFISKTKIITDAKIKGFVISLIKKCKPILDCITTVLAEPLKYIDLIDVFNDNSMDLLIFGDSK